MKNNITGLSNIFVIFSYKKINLILFQYLIYYG